MIMSNLRSIIRRLTLAAVLSGTSVIASDTPVLRGKSAFSEHIKQGGKNKIFAGPWDKECSKVGEFEAAIRREAQNGPLKTLKHELVGIQCRPYVKALRSEDIDTVREAWSQVSEEHSILGVPKNKYNLEPLRNLQDLLEERAAHKKPVFFVEEFGEFHTGTLEVTFDTGRSARIPADGAVLSTLGIYLQTWEFYDTTIRLTEGDIFISKEGSRGEVIMSLFCEPLHHYLQRSKYDLLISINEDLRNGRGKSSRNLREDFNRTTFVEEAVVHGLAQSWFYESLTNLGLSQEDWHEELAGKEGVPKYAGAAHIRSLADSRSRKTVLTEYLQDPVTFLHRLERDYKN